MPNPISDNQRRFACRIIFLLFCAIPTIVVIHFVAHRRTASDWAQIIQSQVGIQTHIGSVETPRPGEMIMRDVRLTDQRGVEILSLMEATVIAGQPNRIIVDDQLRMDSAGLHQLLNQLTDRMVSPDIKRSAWNVDLREAVVMSEPNELGQRESLRLHPVNLFVAATNDGVRATLKTPIADTDQSRDENWVIAAVERSLTTPDIRVEIETGDTQLPCWLAHPWVPQLKRFGYAAQFNGAFRVMPDNDSWRGTLAGNFFGVDISQFVDAGWDDADQPATIRVPGMRLDDTSDQTLAWLDLAGGRQLPIRPFFSAKPSFDLDTAIRTATRIDQSQRAENSFRR